MTTSFRALILAAVFAVAGTSAASAQVIGTFRWQFAPYCNVVTLQLEQIGGVYRFTGTDDQCGGAVVAPVTGTAHQNPNGTIGIGLTLIRPDGISIASSAAIDLNTLSGPWSDEYGSSGTFTFNPAAPAGSPRRVTIRGNFSVIFEPSTASISRDSDAISFGKPLATAPTANFIPLGGAATANCPGSAANPTALPGHLCVYGESNTNVSAVNILNGITAQGTDRTGAIVRVVGLNTGTNTFVTGRWAVTLP